MLRETKHRWLFPVGGSLQKRSEILLATRCGSRAQNDSYEAAGSKPEREKAGPMKPVPRRLKFHRFSTVELLVALALLFFFFPFVEEVKGGDVIMSILLSLVLLSAVLAVADRKGVFFIALVLAIPAIAGRWINHFRPDLVPPPVFLVAGLVLIAFVVANLLRFVLRAPSVNTEVLCASISAYLMLGLLWTVAYWLVAQVTPNAFAFNTRTGTKETMDRFRRFLLQLHHTEHGGLRRHHTCLKDCALACSNGSDDRLALCHRSDSTPGFTLFNAKVSMSHVPKEEEFFISQ